MKITKENLKMLKYIEDNIIDYDISYRGGNTKVDVSGLFGEKTLSKIEDNGEKAIAGTYQNYLGGGIAGSIETGRNFDLSLLNKQELKKYNLFAEAIKEYHYNLNNGGGDDYMQENMSYEKNQSLPLSAY
jgi:hypothetical protein